MDNPYYAALDMAIKAMNLATDIEDLDGIMKAAVRFAKFLETGKDEVEPS
jgi:hypothetical protein